MDLVECVGLFDLDTCLVRVRDLDLDVDTLVDLDLGVDILEDLDLDDTPLLLEVPHNSFSR